MFRDMRSSGHHAMASRFTFLHMIAALTGALAAWVLPCAARAAQPVDLELVIATDVSRSIDQNEARLQREGVADAFLSQDVIEAIRSGILGRIAVAYIDWSSGEFNRVVIDWRVVSDQTSANAFAQDLLRASPTYGQRTSISDALEMAAHMIDSNAFEGTRRAIDVSGDGPNNAGPRVDAVRDQVVARRIVINGLPIKNENDRFDGHFYLEDLDLYYRGCVTGGPGSFVEVAHDFKDFARAIKKKLILEIAGRTPESPPRVMKAAAPGGLTRVQAGGYVYPKGCDIGERMRARIWDDVDRP